MRVLMLHQFDLNLTGGSGVYLRAVRGELCRLGHNVNVVSARPDRYGCTTHPLPFDFTLTFGPEARSGERRLDTLGESEFDATAAQALASITDRFMHGSGPDLVLVNHLSVLTSVASALHREHGVPYRIISFGSDTDLLRRAPRFVGRVSGPAACANRLFAISAFVAKELRDLLPVEDIDILGAAADRRVFYPSNNRELPSPVVSYVGRLVTEKGLWVLMGAMARVHHVSRLDIIGEGPLRGALSEHLADANPALPVELVGPLPQEQLRRRLVTSAAVVVPSIWQEPLALIVAEALACGVPVIATAVGGVAEMVLDGVNGIVVPPGDAAALARALDRVCRDRRFLTVLRQNCVERTVPSYTDVAARLVATPVLGAQPCGPDAG